MHRRYAYASDHKTLDFPSFSVCISHLSTVPSTHQQNCTKMAYNLPQKMMLYFMKCTHFSYRYSITSILYHHEFSYDLIHSLMLFNHPYSKCAYLNVTHYGLKYMLTDDVRRVTYVSRNQNVRAFTWYAYSGKARSKW